MKPAKISKKALADLKRVHARIAKDAPEAAERVWDAVLDIADLLAENAEAGVLIKNAMPKHADVRWFVVPKFRNYLIFYRPHGETILVVRVLHAAQDWTRFF